MTASQNNPIIESILNSAGTIQSLRDHADTIQVICDRVVECLEAGNKLLTAGHGGSAADAMHMSEEFVGRFIGNRRPLPAIALVADGTLMTCIGNDFGFQEIFPRQVEGLGQSGDIFVIFSTSGNGDGYVKAIDIAKRKGMTTIAFLGKTGGRVAALADHSVVVQSNETARIQEAHTLLLHLVLEEVERRVA